MNIFTVTKDTTNFDNDWDYNVVAQDSHQSEKQREFVARKLSYTQAVQLRQECDNAQTVAKVLAGKN